MSARAVKLKAGVVALGSAQGGSYIFSIPEDITVTPDTNGIANFADIEIYEGNLLRKTFRVNDAELNQKYILPNEGIDTSTIRVEAVGSGIEDFIPYSNIFEVDSDSKLFLIQEIQDERYQIVFGDGILGKKPENNALLNITYIVTNGSLANGGLQISIFPEI